MRRLPNRVLLLGGLYFTLAMAGAADAREPQKLAVAGWVEEGWLGEPPMKVKVKLDTGARTSSIHAAQFRAYEKDGKPRVSFTLTNNEGVERTIDAEVVRTASIRRAGAKIQQRPVIRLTLCVAGVTREAEFTMADRSELTYPVLVGRAFLAGTFLVDPARTYRAAGSCMPR